MCIRDSLVEGGPSLQKKIIETDMWDESWVIQTQHHLAKGIAAPDVMGRLITDVYKRQAYGAGVIDNQTHPFSFQ